MKKAKKGREIRSRVTCVLSFILQVLFLSTIIIFNKFYQSVYIYISFSVAAAFVSLAYGNHRQHRHAQARKAQESPGSGEHIGVVED